MAFVEIDVEHGKFGTNGQRYNVFHDGGLVLENCKEPIFDGARALVGLGADLDDTIVMRVNGKVHLTGRIGFCAGHTISEGQNNGPRVIKWTPYFGPKQKDDDDA